MVIMVCVMMVVVAFRHFKVLLNIGCAARTFAAFYNLIICLLKKYG